MKSETMYERIRKLREEKEISQDELAKKCGYSSRSTISKIEKGERNLTGDKIQAIAEALGVKPSYLMDGESPISKEKEKPVTEYDELSEGEQMLLDLFKKVPEDKQPMVIEMIKAALKPLQ